MIPHRTRHALARLVLRGAARLATWLLSPAPIDADGPAVWDLITADVRVLFPDGPVRRRLLREMQARDDLGWAKYGTRLRARNGRDPLLDTATEDLDGCAYSRQGVEQAGPGAARSRATMRYRRRLHLAYTTARDLVRRDGAG